MKRVPRIRLHDRIPPMPWEPGFWGVGGVRVPFETDLTPDPGPIEFLKLIWPERYVVWNTMHQLWEVRQLNPVTCQDERVELLKRLVDTPDGYQVPGYVPFNYEWLHRRAQNRKDFLELGPEKYGDRIDERNRDVSRRKLRDVAVFMADGFRELERYPGPGNWSPVAVAPSKIIPVTRIATPRQVLRARQVAQKGLIVCPS